jgi:hypothetical protein
MIWAQVLIVAYALSLIGLRSRILALLLALLTLVPVQGVSLAMTLRGLWGDPSITTLQLLMLTLAGKTLPSLRSGYRAPLCIALFSAALYASALGPWNLDLYRLGYQPGSLVAVFGAIAMIAWWRGNTFWLWLLTIDLLGWHAGWLESTNLWDALLDPLLMFVMLALALRNGYRASRNRQLLQP